MLTVKTIIGPSKINGIGLFAAEPISKGTEVWRYDPRFDIAFEPEEVKQMSKVQQELIDQHAYLSIEQNKYIYPTDNGRFMNHSSKPNMDVVRVRPTDTETSAVANRDIEVGEEITVDYRLFDAHDAKSNEKYLNT